MEEPQWSRLPASSLESRPCYSRPLIGSELFADQVMVSGDGFGECCMGITFATVLPSEELRVRTLQALVRLRYATPIAAATLESGIHDPQLRSWVYTALSSHEEAQEWASETLTVVHDPVDPSQFIQGMNSNTLPYILKDGSSQYLHLYLIRPSGTANEFGLFFHGTHALMDAHPTIAALNVLLEYISSPTRFDVSLLQWGTEWERLPAGPITSTGGPRPKEEWDTNGNSLMAKVVGLYSNPVPPHSLKCNAEKAVESIRGRPLRVQLQLTASETAAVITSLKKNGFTITHLIDAAVALATFKLNPVSAEDAPEAHITYGSSLISLGRYIVPPHDGKGNFISRFVLVPVTVRHKDVYVSEDEGKRIMVATSALKEQYSQYLANPCLPHLMAEQMRLAPPREGLPMVNPYVSTVVNVGNIENLLPALWPTSQPLPVLRVSSLHFGHRLTLPTPMVHVWTMHGRLVIQIQATDTWEERVMQEYLHEIARQVLLVQTWNV